MIKIIFVLVMSEYYGGIATMDFATLQQCEAAKAQIAKKIELSMTCIEKQVPLKKTKCKIVNNFGYQNPTNGNRSAHNLDRYPYPVELECVEQ